MKTILLCLLLSSCGGGYKVSGKVEVVASIDLAAITKLCSESYRSDEEILNCKNEWIKIMLKLLKGNK